MLTLIVKAFAGNSQCTATSLSRLSAPRSTVIATGPFCDRGHPRMSGPVPRVSQEHANYQILISASNFKGNANTFSYRNPQSKMSQSIIKIISMKACNKQPCRISVRKSRALRMLRVAHGCGPWSGSCQNAGKEW